VYTFWLGLSSLLAGTVDLVQDLGMGIWVGGVDTMWFPVCPSQVEGDTPK